MKGTALAVLLLLTGPFAGCLQEPTVIHPQWLRIESVPAENLDHYSGDPLVRLNRSDVEGRVPFLAEALAEAQREGSASIEGQDRIAAVETYVDAILGREHRAGWMLELEGAYFDVGLETA